MKQTIIAAAALAFMLAGPAFGAGDEKKARALAAEFPKAKSIVDAAFKEDAKAMKSLGVLYEVLRRDLDEAAYWYWSAALKRNARAQLLIANSYQHGRGVPKSNTIAYAWYMAAAGECDQALHREAFNGPTPAKEEWQAARHVHLLITLVSRRFADQADCSEYFDEGTMKR